MLMIKNKNIQTLAKFTYSYEEKVSAVIIGSTKTYERKLFFFQTRIYRTVKLSFTSMFQCRLGEPEGCLSA